MACREPVIGTATRWPPHETRLSLGASRPRTRARTDDTYVVDYALLLRDGATMKAVHDRHVEGVFSRATCLEALASVGFQVQMVERPLGGGTCDEVFLGVRPV